MERNVKSVKITEAQKADCTYERTTVSSVILSEGDTPDREYAPRLCEPTDASIKPSP